jgi:GLPGLI family protein
MKKTLFIILLLIINLTSYSQKQSQLQATYLFNNFDLEQKYKVVLQINANEAFSQFTDILNSKDSLYIDDTEVINFKKESKDSIKNQFYTNSITKKLIFRDFIFVENAFNPVIVEENIPEFNWQLTDGVKKVNNFTCNSAKLKFRGRNYIAWYTLDIPTNFGPWKFYGLPGLITEITSDDNKISFILKEIKTQTNFEIKTPSNGKNITLKEYITFKNNAVKEYIKNLQSKLPRGAVINYKSEDYNIEKSFE